MSNTHSPWGPGTEAGESGVRQDDQALLFGGFEYREELSIGRIELLGRWMELQTTQSAARGPMHRGHRC